MSKLPKKSFKSFSKKPLKAGGIALIVLLLVFGSAFAYVGMGNKLTFRVGGKDLSVLNRNGLRFDIKKEGTGCCSPLCLETTAPECEGFTWTKEGCGMVPDCDKGCCLPTCQTTAKVQCSEEFGIYPVDSWSAKSCGQLKECEIGCCQYQCTVSDMAKAMCESSATGGKWTKGKCATGCCKIEGDLTYQLPKETCEQCHTGSTWYKGDCPKGFYVHLTDKIGGQALKDEFLDALFKAFTGDVIRGEVEMTLDAYTCEATPFSTWTGKLTTKGYASNPATGSRDLSDAQDVTMPFTPDKKSYGLPNLLSVEITETTMKVTLNMIVFEEPIVLEGSLKSGPPECQNKKKN